MSETPRNVVVVLTSGKSDNGKNATLAFSCAVSALAMGHQATIYLTSDGAVWGFQASANGITAQGFPPLSELVERFLQEGGRLVLCSVCHETCGVGAPGDAHQHDVLDRTEIGGFSTLIDLALDGTCITF